MKEKLITKSFERLLTKGLHRGFITYEELGKSLGKRGKSVENLEKIRNLTPLQKFGKRKERKSYKILQETKKIVVAREHLTKEEIKEYSILYIMYNYPKIISPRVEIFKDIKFSSKSLNTLKSELLDLISLDKFSIATAIFLVS